MSKWKNVGSTKPRKGREITHSKLAQKLDTKRTFGLPGHFTDAELEEAIGWRKNKKWGGYEECGPEALRVGLSRTALHQDDYIFVDPFYWQPDVEEIRPNCRLLLVRSTFKFPADEVDEVVKRKLEVLDQLQAMRDPDAPDPGNKFSKVIT